MLEPVGWLILSLLSWLLHHLPCACNLCWNVILGVRLSWLRLLHSGSTSLADWRCTCYCTSLILWNIWLIIVVMSVVTLLSWIRGVVISWVVCRGLCLLIWLPLAVRGVSSTSHHQVQNNSIVSSWIFFQWCSCRIILYKWSCLIQILVIIIRKNVANNLTFQFILSNVW